MTLKNHTKYLQIETLMFVMLGGNFNDVLASTTPGGVTALGKPILVTNNFGLASFRPKTNPFNHIPPEFRHYFTTGIDGLYPKVIGPINDPNIDGDGTAGRFVEYGNFNPKSETMTAVDNTGFYLSYAKYNHSYSNSDIWGVMSDTLFSQSFRKDSTDAQLKFTITAAELETKFDLGTGIADFTTDIRAWKNSNAYESADPFAEFRQYSGIRDQYVGDLLPSITSLENSGPMTFTEENTVTNGTHFHKVKFNPYTGTLDLSSIGVGEEFTLEMYSMALAIGMYVELGHSSAYFQDPLSQSGGVQLEVIGLTPTNNPRVPAVPLPAAAWLFITGIFSLLWHQRRRAA